jgi:Holliday junction resolvase-like predicted endonuclease
MLSLNSEINKPHKDKYESMHNKTLGFNAESIARKWYEKKGWELINQNSRTRNSELDLVMSKNIRVGGEDEYLFVEVKSLEIGQGLNRDNLKPEDNFTKSKQKMFRRGIEQYLVRNSLSPKKLQIDLACVYHNLDKLGGVGEWSIKVYENIILE